MKSLALRHEFVARFPQRLEEGVFYVSMEYGTAAHLCCCGCGHEVITPLSPAGWRITFDGETVTLYPSVGNWSLACQSHYWIEGDRVLWDRRFTREQIAAVRRRDARDLAIAAPREIDAGGAPTNKTVVARIRGVLDSLRWSRRS